MADPNILLATSFEGSIAGMLRRGWVFSTDTHIITTSFVNNSGGYGGVQAYEMYGTLSASCVTPPLTGTPFGLDFSSYVNSGFSGTEYLYITYRLGVTEQWAIQFMADFSINIRRGSPTGTLVASVPAVHSPIANFRHRISLKLLCANAGTFEVLIDGVSVYSFEGDTQNGASPGFDRIAFGVIGNSRHWVLDDLLITDSANGGLFANEQRGTRINPVSTASSTFSGTISGVAALSDGSLLTYNEGLAAGQKELHDFDNLPFAPVRVSALVVHADAFARDGLITGMVPIVKSGGVEYPQSTFLGIGVGSFNGGQRIVQFDPATAVDWTVSGINDVVIGYSLS